MKNVRILILLQNSQIWGRFFHGNRGLCLSGTFGQGIGSTVHIGWVLLRAMQKNDTNGYLMNLMNHLWITYELMIPSMCSLNQQELYSETLSETSCYRYLSFVPRRIGYPVAFSRWCPSRSPIIWSKLSRWHSTLWELVTHRKAFEKSPWFTEVARVTTCHKDPQSTNAWLPLQPKMAECPGPWVQIDQWHAHIGIGAQRREISAYLRGQITSGCGLCSLGHFWHFLSTSLATKILCSKRITQNCHHHLSLSAYHGIPWHTPSLDLCTPAVHSLYTAYTQLKNTGGTVVPACTLGFRRSRRLRSFHHGASTGHVATDVATDVAPGPAQATEAEPGHGSGQGSGTPGHVGHLDNRHRNTVHGIQMHTIHIDACCTHFL